MRTGYSRFPVCAADGAFMGYLHVKDVLDLESADSAVPQRLWRPMITLRAELPLDDALGAMRAAATHLAAVADAAGRALGLVALEDVLEKLVGEVRDPAHRAAPPRPPTGAPGHSPPALAARPPHARRDGGELTRGARAGRAPPAARLPPRRAPARSAQPVAGSEPRPLRAAAGQHLSVRLHQIREPQGRQVVPRGGAGPAGQPQIAVRAALLVERAQEAGRCPARRSSPGRPHGR